MEEERLAYRWPMAIWTMLVGLLVGGMCVGFLPPLFDEITQELGLTHTQIGVIWGAAALGTLLTALGGGLLADRYGPKWVMAIGLLLSVASCALRAVWVSFWGLTVLMLLLGLALGLIFPNMSKVVGMWFGQKELGMALGVVLLGGSLGSVIALMVGVPLSNALGGWRGVMWLTGGIALATFLMWVVLAKTPPPRQARREASEQPSTLEGLKRVIRLKDLWLVCLMEFCVMGALMGFMGHFPQNTVERVGMSAGTAGILTGVGAMTVIVTNIVGPRFSDRLGLRRPFLWPFMVVGLFATTFLGLATGPALYLLVIVLGASAGVVLPLFRAVIIENPRIGPLLAGSAFGFLYMVNRIGATLAPIIMGWIQDATSAYWPAYLFLAVLCGAAALLGYLVKETGTRAKKPADAGESAGAVDAGQSEPA